MVKGKETEKMGGIVQSLSRALESEVDATVQMLPATIPTMAPTVRRQHVAWTLMALPPTEDAA